MKKEKVREEKREMKMEVARKEDACAPTPVNNLVKFVFYCPSKISDPVPVDSHYASDYWTSLTKFLLRLNKLFSSVLLYKTVRSVLATNAIGEKNNREDTVGIKANNDNENIDNT